MREFIKGKYIKSIYQSDKGYVIGNMKVLDTNIDDAYDFIDKTLTFTGYFPELKAEENYMFYGEMVDHPKYGIQFSVTESELILPDTKDGVIIFLSSDLFPGIGEKQAEKIVNTLGENAIDRILNEPGVLNLVPKLSKKKIDVIVNTLNEYSKSHRTIVALTDLGFTMKDAMSIYNYYKEYIFEVLKENPYDIIDNVDDITFLKIDKIRKNLSVEEFGKQRIKACIFYIINQLLFEMGDTYLLVDEILKKVEEYLEEKIEIELFLNYLDELILEDKIVIEEEKIYTKKIYDSEETIVDTLNRLVNREKNKIKKLDEKISFLEEADHIKYNEKQKIAIKTALENNIVVITGGPGTGKTTIIKAITKLYSIIYEKEGENLYKDLALLAPTGRASKRMSESSNLPASTIHRFLKWDKDSNEFMVNETNKAPSKLVIVDEASMIDTELMASLLKGLTSDIRLVLVGDKNQLPSVGPGTVLKDIIESGKVKTIYLDLLYRQSDSSYIPILAEEIRNNDLSENFTEKKDDYLFLECPKEMITKSIENIASQLLEKGYDSKRSIFLAPMYAGINGIDNINKILQNIFNPKDATKKEIKVGNVIYREKDKILQLVNNPDENVFNGDVGYIEYILTESESTSKKDEIYINFDGNIIKYLPKDMNKIKHGYIISIHKSQGSEFELVVMPICISYYRMLYRKLIYTAITRAKQKLIIIGEKKAFLYAVSNEYELSRKTSLKEKLENV